MDLQEAHHQIATLRKTLRELSAKDPDQEVQGIAIPVVDLVLTEARKLLPANHPVVGKVADVISPETVSNEGGVRAADMLHVVNAVYAALIGPYTDWVNMEAKAKRTLQTF